MATPRASTIKLRYGLVTFIPHYVDENGGIWLDELWHRDLAAQMTHTEHMTLAAPRKAKGSVPNLLLLGTPPGRTLTCVPLGIGNSLLHALLRLPLTIWTLWRMIGRIDILQSGVAGWPYPVGWVANCIARLRRRHVLLIVESATWRLSGTGREGWRHRVRARVFETLARWFVNRADLVFFTHPEYQRSLLTRGRGQGVVVPATWIQDDDLLSETQAISAWTTKEPIGDCEIRFVFAGRLTLEKGIGVVLEAARILDRAGVRCRIDVIGDGSERESCLDAARGLTSVRMNVVDPVPYGRPFFELLRSYHAVLVPSLSDEQPRVLFDAFAQAVPVVASDSPGLAAYVRDGANGWLVRRHDPVALAATLQSVIAEPASLLIRGLASLASARRLTHGWMHETRARIVNDCFDPRP